MNITLDANDLSAVNLFADVKTSKSCQYSQKNNECVDSLKVYANQRLGVASEVAAAKALGVFYNGNLLTPLSKGDLAPNIEVRATKHRNGYLTLRKGDLDTSKFILVIANDELTEFRIAGWILGILGKKEQYYRLQGSTIETFNVPQSKLQPIEELKILMGNYATKQFDYFSSSTMRSKSSRIRRSSFQNSFAFGEQA